MLKISPNELKATLELNKEIRMELKLTNTSDSMIAFKVRTTQEHSFVRPKEATIPSGESIICAITVKPMSEYPDPSDKDFLRPKYQFLSVATDTQPASWKEFWKAHKKCEDTRIRCKLSVPASVRAEQASLKGLKSLQEAVPVADSTAEETKGNLSAPSDANLEKAVVVAKKREASPTPVKKKEPEPVKLAVAAPVAKPVVKTAQPLPVAAPVVINKVKPVEPTSISTATQPIKAQPKPPSKSKEEKQPVKAAVTPDIPPKKVTSAPETKTAATVETKDEPPYKEWFEKVTADAARLEKRCKLQQDEVTTVRKENKRLVVERDSLLSEVTSLTRRITALSAAPTAADKEEDAKADILVDGLRKRKGTTPDFAQPNMLATDELDEPFEALPEENAAASKPLQFQPWQLVCLLLFGVLVGKLLV